jgi:hypothetical protein
MIQYSCDLCNRPIDSEDDIRYVVKIEVYAALDAQSEVLDDERDGLEQLQEMLQRMDDGECVTDEDVYQQLRFDLCPECRKKFVKHPLGRTAKQFDFSQN